jgi:hypothetical protein
MVVGMVTGMGTTIAGPKVTGIMAFGSTATGKMDTGTIATGAAGAAATNEPSQGRLALSGVDGVTTSKRHLDLSASACHTVGNSRA